MATSTTASAAAGLTWIFFDMLRGRNHRLWVPVLVLLLVWWPLHLQPGLYLCRIRWLLVLFRPVVSNLVVEWRTRTTIDDTLDVFPCHGVGGMVGMLLTGVFANQNVNAGNTTGNGLFFGETHLFFVQSVGFGWCFDFRIFWFVAIAKNYRYDIAVGCLLKKKL